MSLTDVSGTWPKAWRRDGAQASGNRHSRLSALPGRMRPRIGVQGGARRTKQPARRIAPQSRWSRMSGHAACNASELAASVRHMVAVVRRESAMRRHRVPPKSEPRAGAQEGVTRFRTASILRGSAHRRRTPECERRPGRPGAAHRRGIRACLSCGAPAAGARR